MSFSKYVTDVCKIGQGNACCRYLMFSADEGFECAKLQTDQIKTLQDVISGRTQLRSPREAIDENVKNGLMTAIGDNCEGKDPIPE